MIAASGPLVLLGAEGLDAARVGLWSWNAVGALIALALAVPAAVGAVIPRARPGHPIGWIMLLGPLPVGVLFALETYAGSGVEQGRPHLAGAALAGGIALGLWPAFYVWPMALALLFPDGRLVSRRWRPVLWVALGCPLVVALGSAVGSPRIEEGLGGLENPLYIGRDALDLLMPVFWVHWGLMLAALFAAAGSVVVRHRRSSGVERLQLKWLAWAAWLVPTGLLACVAWQLAGGDGLVVVGMLLGAGAALSVAVGIAITRHGLYAIDRIVNRTLVYVAVSAVLAGAFAGVVLGAGVLVGRGSPWATAVASLVVAVAFRPLRDRTQRAVDRRFARDRYEGLRAVRAFEESVRAGTVEPEQIGEVLARALGDPGAALLLRLPATGGLADVDGTPAPGPVPASRAVTPVHRKGEEIAALVHDPDLLTRPDTLRSVVSAAALPIEMARLRAEIRLQLAEVEASRERIVRAGDEERRRLERDLHDGAQQRLVGLGVALRRIQRSLPSEARVLAPSFDEAVAEVARAIADLRTIAAGLRPPRLDDGLHAALADLARTAPLPVHVEVEAGELSPPIELAAYYAVCEALTNAVKHAGASRVEVSAVRRGGRLVVRVRDDGAGGARPGGGTGLTGIADRVGAHGGTIRVDSGAGLGTLVEVELPCAS